jgi:recombinational DNA repair ATPase RecF
MKIKEINISGIGCIHNLHLEFNDKMNIICGPNGIGKTTIIESVASMFMFGKTTIKRY